MSDFRSGGYNVLIATSIGEEGLDIGSVDLIICFDALKSPIRLVQRMGRTGRARQGRIVLLMTELVGFLSLFFNSFFFVNLEVKKNELIMKVKYNKNVYLN